MRLMCNRALALIFSCCNVLMVSLIVSLIVVVVGMDVTCARVAVAVCCWHTHTHTHMYTHTHTGQFSLRKEFFAKDHDCLLDPYGTAKIYHQIQAGIKEGIYVPAKKDYYTYMAQACVSFVCGCAVLDPCMFSHCVPIFL